MTGPFNIHHEASHGDQVVSFSFKPLVLSTMPVPHDELLISYLTNTVQDLSVQPGHDEEGPVRLVIKVPLLVTRGWAVPWVAYDFGTVLLVGLFNIKHESVQVSLDVNIQLKRERNAIGVIRNWSPGQVQTIRIWIIV